MRAGGWALLLPATIALTSCAETPRSDEAPMRDLVVTQRLAECARTGGHPCVEVELRNDTTRAVEIPLSVSDGISWAPTPEAWIEAKGPDGAWNSACVTEVGTYAAPSTFLRVAPGASGRIRVAFACDQEPGQVFRVVISASNRRHVSGEINRAGEPL